MSFLHDEYTVKGEPETRGHIVRLRIVTLAFHAWNKFTIYVCGWRIFNSRDEGLNI
jgi:hypothetical protein